jgi:hypothetical protein
MELSNSIRGPVCLRFGDESTQIEIRIADDAPATVSIESQRAQSCGLLQPLERKLLALALDRAAEPGEIRNCAQKLIESWRARGLVVEEFERKGERTIDSYGSRLVGFGQYQGHRVGDLPTDYLQWMVDTPGIRQRYPDIVEAAEAVLKRRVR